MFQVQQQYVITVTYMAVLTGNPYNKYILKGINTPRLLKHSQHTLVADTHPSEQLR